MFDGKGHNPTFSATNEFCDELRNFIRTGRAERTFQGLAAGAWEQGSQRQIGACHKKKNGRNICPDGALSSWA
jgi:hypothetical protein